jgi:hypothetical protein
LKLTRPKRIALELLGPPIAGGLVVGLIAAVAAILNGVEFGFRAGWLLDCISGMFVVVVGSFMVSGIQSLVFTAIMEWRFSRGLGPHRWQTVVLASALGFASGAVIVPVLDGHPVEHLDTIATLGVLGLVVGFAIGLLIKIGSRIPTRGSDSM